MFCSRLSHPSWLHSIEEGPDHTFVILLFWAETEFLHIFVGDWFMRPSSSMLNVVPSGSELRITIIGEDDVVLCLRGLHTVVRDFFRPGLPRAAVSAVETRYLSRHGGK